MKKRLLIVNESLACAGGEKSLLNLLSVIDAERFDVDLQLMEFGNPWEELIPDWINVLPRLPYTEFTSLPLRRAFVYALRHRKFRWLRSRLRYSRALRRNPAAGNIEKACLYWQTQSGCFSPIATGYDYVIAYAQGVPTFYVADKTPAGPKKLAWINATYLPKPELMTFIVDEYSRIDRIVAVSETTFNELSDHFPSFGGKLECFRDLINPDMIRTLSEQPVDYRKTPGRLTLVTLGRLAVQKGYDIAIETAAALKRDGIDFEWLILGKGPLEGEIREMIRKYDLENQVKLLGVKPNPYPYLALADIYVQTSRLEGFGLAIAEARMLNIPVVTTRFNTVFMQMVDGKNGLVTDLNGAAVAGAIECLVADPALRSSIVGYLTHEPKGNLETLPKFYELLR